MTKHCNICNRDLPFDMFHIRRASHDGLCARCKDCQSVYDAARKHKPDRVAARLNYRARPSSVDAFLEGSKRWREKNRLKREAHVIVGNAIRDGKLKRQPCEVCSDLKVDAHHDDYSKPLAVRWLCIACHAAHHNRIRALERIERLVRWRDAPPP